MRKSPNLPWQNESLASRMSLISFSGHKTLSCRAAVWQMQMEFRFSPDSWKLKGFLLLKNWVADPHNRQMVVMPPSPCLPSLSPFWAALGRRCRPVSLHLSPCMISILACSCGCRLVSLHLSPCMISILACSWLLLPPCLPSFVSLRDLPSGLLLAAAAALSPFICLPAWSPFWAALGCRCHLVSLHFPRWVADCQNR